MATLAAQALSFGFFICLGYGQKLSFVPRDAIKGFRMIKDLFFTGAPSLLRQGFAAVASVLLTRSASVFGDAAISAVSIVARLFLVLLGFCLGIGQGMMPAVSYSLGKKDEKKIRSLYIQAMMIATVVLLLPSAIFFFFPKFWISLFRSENDILRYGGFSLRLQAAVAPLHGIMTVTTLYYQSMQKKLAAALLAVARQGIFFIPLILILPRKFAIMGLLSTQAIADVAAFLFCIPFVIFALRGRKKAETLGK